MESFIINRKLFNFSKCTGLALTSQKILDVSVVEESKKYKHNKNGNLSPSTIIYIETGDKLPISKSYYKIVINDDINRNNSNIPIKLSSSQKKEKIHLAYRSHVLSEIRSICHLFKEFEDGTRILNQDELSGLASTLIQIESGSKKFMDVLRTNLYFNDNKEKYSNWNYQLNYLKKKDCKSSLCTNYCPYVNQCNHAMDILSTTRPERHAITKLANSKQQFYHRDEAMQDFSQNFKTSFEAEDNKIHILNAPIAMGKSTSILEYMEKSNVRILVAFPSNDLKNELYTKAIARGIKAVKSPSLLEVEDKFPLNT